VSVTTCIAMAAPVASSFPAPSMIARAEPCPTCATPVRVIRQAGRSTFYCPVASVDRRRSLPRPLSHVTDCSGFCDRVKALSPCAGTGYDACPTFCRLQRMAPQLSPVLEKFSGWLVENELTDAQTDRRISLLLDKLREDRLHVAFVAEFSRGKSELINAIFFADYGNRILPSTAGRTTMCPTELMFDASKPPSIELAADREPRVQYQHQRVQALSRRVDHRPARHRFGGGDAGGAAPCQRSHPRRPRGRRTPRLLDRATAIRRSFASIRMAASRSPAGATR
jgi:hypothetical protein